MPDRVKRAPKLFTRAAIVLDFGGLSTCPDTESVRELITGLRSTGVLPVALAYGTDAVEALASALALPVLAKFRAQYEPATSPAEPASRAAQAASPEPQPAAPTNLPRSEERPVGKEWVSTCKSGG